MYPFELTRAKTVADAAAALGKSGGKLLAGGQSLVGAMKLRLAQPGTLVDLSGIAELKGIRKEGDALVIGAMTRHAEIAASAAVKSAIPVLAMVAHGIGDRQVRNMGTIGGALANNDPAADWPAAVLALGATVQTNKRKIAADDFFKGMYETALAADEIITAVSFPIPKKAAYCKFPNPASRFALTGVFCRADGERRTRRGDRRRAGRLPRAGAGAGADEELHGGCGEGGQDRRQGALRRSPCVAGVPRAPDSGAGRAGGRGRGLGRRAELAILRVGRRLPLRPIFLPSGSRDAQAADARVRRRRQRAARRRGLHRRAPPRDQRLPRAQDGTAAVPRRRGGRGQDRDREGARHRPRQAPGAAAVLRRPRRRRRGLRMELRAADDRDPARRIGRPSRSRPALARHLHDTLPAEAPDPRGAGAAGRHRAGAADRRARPRRRAVRGVPARSPRRVPGDDSRARPGARRSRRPSSSSRRTGPARSTTRSSAAACITGSDTRTRSASSPSSCASARRRRRRSRGRSSRSRSGCARSTSSRRPASPRRSTGPRRWSRSTASRSTRRRSPTPPACCSSTRTTSARSGPDVAARLVAEVQAEGIRL